jgi:hypothetical protein
MSLGAKYTSPEPLALRYVAIGKTIVVQRIAVVQAGGRRGYLSAIEAV